MCILQKLFIIYYRPLFCYQYLILENVQKTFVTYHALFCPISLKFCSLQLQIAKSLITAVTLHQTLLMYDFDTVLRFTRSQSLMHLNLKIYLRCERSVIQSVGASISAF